MVAATTGMREGTSPIRNYVVLEQHSDESGPFYVEVSKVPARNPTNAMRAAFRELAKGRDDEDVNTTLVVVPETMWRPTAVKARVHSRVSVSIG